MYQQPDPYRPYVPTTARSPRRRTMFAVGGASAVAAAAVLAVVYSTGGAAVVAGSGSAVQAAPATGGQGGNGGGSGSTGGSSNGGSGSTGGSSNGGSGSTTSTGMATAAQQVGIVDIDTVLKYQRAAAAGTGMILSSSGEILTNNHVVDGATSISVQVVTSGKTYQATVVGTDPTQDVAVIQLQNASGLQTADIADTATPQVGAAVTGVGNAGGSGGTPSAAAGTIVALNQALTATDESGQNPEKLTGMIETDAPIQAGDSGGPLYDSSAQVVGMDTAASANGRRTTAGFAIPIAHATTIAGEIEGGQASATVHLGLPGFLGVSVTAGASVPGALIQSVLPGGSAAQVGIGAGDVITSVGGTSVRSATALGTAVAAYKPGQRVAVAWLDTSGQAHHATLTLGTGPAD